MRALLAGLILLAASPSRAADLVLDCYLRQYVAGQLQSFVRRLDVDQAAGRVAIADDVGGGGLRALGAYGRLVTLDDAQLVFDFASSNSSGRATVDRGTGAYSYNDGHAVITGTCSPSRL